MLGNNCVACGASTTGQRQIKVAEIPGQDWTHFDTGEKSKATVCRYDEFPCCSGCRNLPPQEFADRAGIVRRNIDLASEAILYPAGR